MVHSIKSGCKNWKPLRGKFAITLHNAHAYSLLWQFLPRQNMSKLRRPCHLLRDTVTSFCSLICQGDPWNASVWYWENCITMQQGCWEFKNIDMCLHIFTVVNIKIPVCWRTVFSETQETVIQKQSFRGAPSTSRNSDIKGSSFEEISSTVPVNTVSWFLHIQS
jgi:hypothetical protein